MITISIISLIHKFVTPTAAFVWKERLGSPDFSYTACLYFNYEFIQFYIITMIVLAIAVKYEFETVFNLSTIHY